MPKISYPFFYYFLRKAAFYMLAYFIAVSLVWLIPRLMPGDPIINLVNSILSASGMGGTAGGGAGGTAGQWSVSEEVAQKLYTFWIVKFGLDKPLLEQYFLHLKNSISFDFGVSIQYYPLSVLGVINLALPWSLLLLLPASIIGWILGCVLGAYTAYKRGVLDRVVYPIFLTLSRAPLFWFALILIYIFIYQFRIFPPGGAYSFFVKPSLTLEFILDYLRHYTLPFITVLLPILGGQAIGMRAMTIYEINSDYLNYSEMLGIKEGKLLRYAFRNAILVQTTGLPLQVANAFSGQLVMEVVFGYPGIGFYLYDAIINMDYTLIQGCFTVIILVVLIGNFLIDILYAYIDPRIRKVIRGE
jgi:peptide/nickel transport system permease protein